MKSYILKNINQGLPRMLESLLSAPEVGSRNGRCRELTNVALTVREPLHRELTLPGRKANLAAQVAETMWVLSGRADIGWLGHYLPRAADFSDDGETWRAGYGPRLRSWVGSPTDVQSAIGAPAAPVDQLATVVDRLRANPMDRRAVISLWDPVVDSEDGKDIACNNWLAFSNRGGKLDVLVGVRSNDAMWGWSGINLFEWSVLQEIVARLVGVQVGELHFATASFHLYETHWHKAEKILAERSSTPWQATEPPRFGADSMTSIATLDTYIARWFEIEEKVRNHAPPYGGMGWVQAIEDFPEPMMQSWLRVLAWWWTGDQVHLMPLKDTRLWFAAQVSVQPKAKPARTETGTYAPAEKPHFDPSDFVRETQQLHTSKHAAYGDSWKRRGEMLGILANIARKVDRLGNGETDDETQADTAADLMVYLAKYATWIDDQTDGGVRSDTPDAANRLLEQVERRLENDRRELRWLTVEQLENWLELRFNELEEHVVDNDNAARRRCVDDMLDRAFVLARLRWDAATADQADDDYQGADVD